MCREVVVHVSAAEQKRVLLLMDLASVGTILTGKKQSITIDYLTKDRDTIIVDRFFYLSSLTLYASRCEYAVLQL
jgi:hypothetical protein